MTARPKHNLTVEEYFKAYEGIDGRYELVDGDVRNLPSETVQHVRLKGQVTFSLADAISRSGVEAEVFLSGIGIRTATNTVRDPDVSVQGGKMLDEDSYLLSNPVIVVEIASPSSEGADEHRKLAEYFSVASIMHYLIVWPKQNYCYHHKRIDDNIVLTTIVRSGMIEFDPPGVSISFESIFSGVDR